MGKGMIFLWEKKRMKAATKAMILMSLALGFAGQARAEFSFACGEGKEKGPQQAEVGLLDSMETAMKFYLKGEEIADEKLGIKPTESNVWIVSIDEGEAKGTRTFEISQGNSSVQEFFTNAKGKTKKVGASKPCVFKQWEPKAE